MSVRTDEIHDRIVEGGGVLAALIGKDFPDAGEVFREVNQFHRMIDDYGLNDTWVSMITPDERDVSKCALCFLNFMWLLTLFW